MYKIIILLIILNMITYSEMFSSGREYLKKVINLKIEFFNEKGKNTCKYQIDKFNNLIYSKNEAEEEKVLMENDVYSYNDSAYKSSQAQEYKFWLDKKLDLQNKGLYIDDKLFVKNSNSEEIYLVEYKLDGEVITKVPIILKKNYIVNGIDDNEKISILSDKKILKEIQYFRLYELIDYLNKIKNCY